MDVDDEDDLPEDGEREDVAPEGGSGKKPARERKRTARADDLSDRPSIRNRLIDEVFADVEAGFQDQWERSNAQMDYWDVYNGVLSGKQFYSGNSRIFVPIVQQAVDARVTRFTNQVFPVSGRNVEVTTEDGTLPHALMSLMEHYVRRAKLRTKVVPALMRAGDVEGQYNVYVSWGKHTRHVAHRVTEDLQIDDDLSAPGVDEHETVREETIVRQFPKVEVLNDADVLVLPATADTVEEALEVGGSATVIRRWTKATIRRLVKDGTLVKSQGRKLIKSMSSKDSGADVDPKAKMVDMAGIKGASDKKHAVVYETWTNLKVDGKERLCVAYYGGEENVLGVKLCPYWADRCPIFSVPVKKVAGSFKGKSLVEPCCDLQYAANDAINEGMDSAAYALMPIVMTDPLKNPRIGSMILSVAAIWETNPNDTKFAQFPQLWKESFDIVAAAKSEVFQTLSVNPSMVTQSTARGGAKRNQAEVAAEQQVDILTTADAVTVLEEGILTPLLAFFLELDHQYRSKTMTIKQFGRMGIRATMDEIPPVQMDHRYEFRWFGVEAARSAQQIQQQISALNILRGIPPAQYQGYRVNLVPIITQLVENTFGPRLAPLVFEDMRSQLTLDPNIENDLMVDGIDMPVQIMDDDAKHAEMHIAAMKATKDPHRTIATHLMRHQMQAQQKAAQMQQEQQPGQPGMPGGAGPGVAGTPRPGAQPRPPRGGQQPPGAIHRDQLRDPRAMPRKT